MRHFLYLTALLLSLVFTACNQEDSTGEPAAVESTPPDETTSKSVPENSSMGESGSTQAVESSEPEICSPEWFTWLNQQIQAMPDGKMAELYPGGLPEVGTDEWFIAIDSLTGGDGAHGPDGGSAEWCSMIKQRLSQNE